MKINNIIKSLHIKIIIIGIIIIKDIIMVKTTKIIDKVINKIHNSSIIIKKDLFLINFKINHIKIRRN